MAKVYLAGRYSRRKELLRVADRLANEHVITARWLTGVHEWTGTPDDQIPEHAQAWFARDDLDDIRASDAIVCFTEESGTGPARGGRHVEMGIALGWGIPVIVCGPIENVFYALPEVIKCSSVGEVRRALYWLDMGASPRVVNDRIDGDRSGPTLAELVDRFTSEEGVEV